MLSFNEFIKGVSILESFDFEFYEFIGEESTILEKARSTSTGIQPWAKHSAPKNDDEIDDFINNKIKPFIDETRGEYERGMKKLAQYAKNAKVLFSEKKPASVISKIKRGKDLTKIHDMLRGAILVSSESDVKAIDKKIKNVFRIYEREFKDFGGDKELGYFGSYHYKVELKNGMIAEIQVMTKSLWASKSEAHKIYNQTREKLATDPSYKNSEEFKKLQKRSRDLFRRGAGDKKVQIR